MTKYAVTVKAYGDHIVEADSSEEACEQVQGMAYDKMWKHEAVEEQSLWDEAQDEAARARADDFNEHTEDVP